VSVIQYPSMADFGTALATVDIDDAAITTLQTWLPTYLSHFEVERQLAQGYLPRPKKQSFSTTIDNDEWLDHVLPAVIVTTVSTAGPPAITADDSYKATWNMAVSCICRGRKGPESRRIASWFELCVRQLLVQQGSLGQIVNKCRWFGTEVRQVADATSRGRYLAAGIAQYQVYADVAVQGGFYGPTVPLPDATQYQDLATVQEIDVSVTGDMPPTDLDTGG